MNGLKEYSASQQRTLENLHKMLKLWQQIHWNASDLMTTECQLSSNVNSLVMFLMKGGVHWLFGRRRCCGRLNMSSLMAPAAVDPLRVDSQMGGQRDTENDKLLPFHPAYYNKWCNKLSHSVWTTATTLSVCEMIILLIMTNSKMQLLY